MSPHTVLSTSRCLTAALTASLLTALPAVGQTTFSASFGFEDGSSTSVGQFPADAAALTNVTSGTSVDFGPSDAPFAVPATQTITAFEGDRLLQVTEVDTSSPTPNVVLANIENLNQGDTYSFSFRAFDPSDGRSPSVIPNAVFTTDDGPNSFAGFSTPFQLFDDFPGSGFLLVQADADPGNGVPDPNIVFDQDGDPTRTGIALRAAFFAPSLAADNGGSFDFFIDDIQVSVTTTNPDARIVFADGTVVAVPEPTTAAAVGLGALALLRRRRPA